MMFLRSLRRDDPIEHPADGAMVHAAYVCPTAQDRVAWKSLP
jgi:hypothetical protein